MIFNRNGHLFHLDAPAVMGIVNVTPDSFYSGSRFMDPSEALSVVDGMIADGADIIDFGACSTRPGAETVTSEVELQRLSPVLDAVRTKYPDILISIDTFYAATAATAAARWRVDIINDISGVSDPDMPAVIAANSLVYVLMHSRSVPSDMQNHCNYKDVTAEVISELAFRLDLLRAKGVKDVIIDPGFGFAKNLDQNYQLMAELSEFKKIGPPVLVGISRKSMITSLLGRSPGDVLHATTALNTAAMMEGADIVRVHDVRAAADAARIIRKLNEYRICRS